MARLTLLPLLVTLTAAGCLAPKPLPVARATPGAAPTPATLGRPARHILALSGGGSYGAFTAGVLTGWTRSNSRPEFDVVTGVSTGALIAPLAFLGPDYDLLMRRFYTEIGPDDILTPHYWAQVPFRASISSNAPLRDILDKGITPEVVAQIAAEHKKGRRLYVATTQLDTRKTVVWDVGEVAGGPGGRALVIDILLASCAVPGVFPPIRLPGEAGGPGEWHVDGGTTAPIFVPPSALENAADGAQLYVIVAGKFYPDESQVPPRLVKVLGASGAALMHAMIRREVANLYHMAKLARVEFHSASIRLDFPVRDTGIEFDTASMNRMYVEGISVGRGGPGWSDGPAERGPGGQPGSIRTGAR